MTISAADKRVAFRKLHESGCFVIPNPWDIGSAKWLQHLGFKALASTSAGFAWTIGKADNAVSVDDVVTHLAELCGATDLPVNADFEAGFSETPDGLAINAARAVKAGVAGLSIEDSTADKKLYPRDVAIERMRAARKGIDGEDKTVILVGRSEGFLVGQPDLKETIDRLLAYAEAGADCLYAPGLRKPEDMAAVVKAVAPKPVNLLLALPGMSVNQAADLGVRRISVGGSLARAAYAAAFAAAKELAEEGTFGGFGKAGISGGDLNKIMRG